MYVLLEIIGLPDYSIRPQVGYSYLEEIEAVYKLCMSNWKSLGYQTVLSGLRYGIVTLKR